MVSLLKVLLSNLDPQAEAQETRRAKTNAILM